MSTIKTEESIEEHFTHLEHMLADSKNSFEISQRRFLRINKLLVDINARLDKAEWTLKVT